MKRRQFLQSGSLLTIPALVGGFEVTALTKSSLFAAMQNNTDRVLVLIQMNGGNDGLNMVIPIDQYSGLSQVRSNLLIPESSILSLTDKTGLHPGMIGLESLYKEEKLAVVQAVGYPNQNRSHFRSTDIWTSGSSSNVYLSSGWSGRYLDSKYPGYPNGYPNAENPDPLAITLGSVVSETCQGSIANFSFVLRDEASVRLVEETVARPKDSTCYSDEITYVRNTIAQSNDYAERVLEAFDKGNNTVTYPDSNLAGQLKTVANLISGGLQTKIYVVNIGGFDTHANQVVIGETNQGTHADLLTTLSDAIAAFTADCKGLGLAERVVGMTFSEFGRQIRANNSFGTDHGTAAPLFVFGSCVQQGIYGENPVIGNPDQIAAQEGVPMQYDFRSVYASLLIDWMEVSENDVKTILFDDFQRIPFIKNCSIPSSVDDEEIFELSVHPNPTYDRTELIINNTGNYVKVEIYDVIGGLVTTIVQKSLDKGNHTLPIAMGGLTSGTYFIRVQIDNKVKTMKVVKM